MSSLVDLGFFLARRSSHLGRHLEFIRPSLFDRLSPNRGGHDPTRTTRMPFPCLPSSPPIIGSRLRNTCTRARPALLRLGRRTSFGHALASTIIAVESPSAISNNR